VQAHWPTSNTLPGTARQRVRACPVFRATTKAH
jgi:hypothetical protein